ncbi:SET domain-containing protein [Lenzites betulinus]|nr:SET domain-containing protein [Lenzites betulinus]
MELNDHEPSDIVAFKRWLAENGAHIHPHAHFKRMASGFDVIAVQDIPADTTVVSIPFSLAITPEVSKRALETTLYGDQHGTSEGLEGLSERQLVCAYLCMHWIAERSQNALRHGPYIDTLPSPERLLTPLHFTPAEIDAFRGSNLHGAALDRRSEWEAEWAQCKAVISTANQTWGDEFTWNKYLTASTYLSSRAFPSTVLSETPSLVTTPASCPVLLPGIDSLNHARAQPVSWVVSRGVYVPGSSGTPTGSSEPSISLVIHTPTDHGRQLFNNYGPKPNSELILGYGFSLANNPDDTIVLKLGGPSAASAPAPSSSRWEVGRDAHGAEPVWQAVLDAIGAQNGDDDDEDMDADDPPSVEDDLCAADMLAEMAQSLYDRLPSYPPLNASEMRSDVVEMLEHYIEGQRDILQSLVEFAREKEAQALQQARELGLDIIEEDEELEED